MKQFCETFTYKKPMTERLIYLPEICRMIGQKSELNDNEIRRVNGFVDYRQEACELFKAQDHIPYDKEERKKEARRNGAGAEIAFAKLFGGIAKLKLRQFNWATDYGDVMLWGGIMVDVKNNTLKYGNAVGKLLIRVDHYRKACVPIFALMIGAFPDYVFGGFCITSEVPLLAERVGKVGKGENYPDNYIIPPDELRDYTEINWQDLKNEKRSNVSAMR